MPSRRRRSAGRRAAARCGGRPGASAASSASLRRDPLLHGLVEQLVAAPAVAPWRGTSRCRRSRGSRPRVSVPSADSAMPMLALTCASSSPRRNGACERGDDALGDVGRVVHAVDVLAQHDELVATEPGDGVGLAHRGLDPRGRLDEQLVADRVAERVVDRLEPVEVDVQHAAHAVVAPDAGERLVEPVGEHHPVRQPGQRVVQRLVRELRLELLLVGEIADDARDDRRGARRRRSRSSPPSSGTAVRRAARPSTSTSLRCAAL